MNRNRRLKIEALETRTLLNADPVEFRAEPIVLDTPGGVFRLDHSLRFAGNGIYIAAPNVTVDLNGHNLYYGSASADNSHGVVFYISWANTELSIPNATEPHSPKVLNGSIIHEGTGSRSHAIYAFNAYNSVIDRVNVIANGIDSHTVYFSYGSSTIRNSVLTCNSQDTFDRHQLPANVRVAGGVLVAEDNILVGGSTGFLPGNGSVIRRNLIAHNSHATNGAGVVLFEGADIVIEDNLILPTNGRGITLSAAYRSQVVDNIMFNMELPNSEYGEFIVSTGLRARFNLEDNVVSGNISLGIGGGGRTTATGLAPSNYVTDHHSNVYENNSFTTILVGAPDIAHNAVALDIADNAPIGNIQDTIRNNTFQSNQFLLRTENPSGWAKDRILIGNNFNFIDGDNAQIDFMAVVRSKLLENGMASNPIAVQLVADFESLLQSLLTGVPLQESRRFWVPKWAYYSDSTEITVLDSVFGPGVNSDSIHLGYGGEGRVSLRVGRTVDVVLQGRHGPLANVAVQVTSDRGDTYLLTTDDSGRIDLPLIEFGIDREFSAGSPFLKVARHSTSVTVEGYKSVVVQNSAVNDGDAVVFAKRAKLATGSGAGTSPQVKVFDAATSELLDSFLAYDAGFTGGVRTALGDVNGDGMDDIITAAGPGGGPHVRVFDGQSLQQLPGHIGSFFAYGANFIGGVFVASSDVNGDGRNDIITGAGAGGGPHVKIFSGLDGAELRGFFAFSPSFTGGVAVAVGDINGDGTDDVIAAAGPGGGPHVRVFDGRMGNVLPGPIGSFFAYHSAFNGGVWVASADVNGDGRDDVITGPGAGGGPHVKVFSGVTGGELLGFLAYNSQFVGGVTLTAADIDGDGKAEIITGAGPGGGPEVRVFSGLDTTQLSGIMAYAPVFAGGVFVSAAKENRPNILPDLALVLDDTIELDHWHSDDHVTTAIDEVLGSEVW